MSSFPKKCPHFASRIQIVVVSKARTRTHTHLLAIAGYIQRHKLVGSRVGQPYNAKCYCVTEVLLTSCPASQASSNKLLSSMCPSAGKSVGVRGVGGSIRLGGYWKRGMRVDVKFEVLQLQT